jgi:hypothetical protein
MQLNSESISNRERERERDQRMTVRAFSQTFPDGWFFPEKGRKQEEQVEVEIRMQTKYLESVKRQDILQFHFIHELSQRHIRSASVKPIKSSVKAPCW